MKLVFLVVNKGQLGILILILNITITKRGKYNNLQIILVVELYSSRLVRIAIDSSE